MRKYRAKGKERRKISRNIKEEREKKLKKKK
jgi:hypothetical protein